MRTITENELKDILRLHKLWLNDKGGKRADLTGANLTEATLASVRLTEANLTYANLQYANLQYAKLQYANLQYANLQYANLQYANLLYADLQYADLTNANLTEANLHIADLTGVTGLVEPSEWLAANFERNADGELVVYKVFNMYYEPSQHWLIEPGSIITEEVNNDRRNDCGCGINVATVNWLKSDMPKNGKVYEIWKCTIPIDAEDTIVVPYATDGKFRVGKLKLIEIID